MVRLTVKREAFVQALLSGKSQREAYREAGYRTDGMSNEAVDVEACKLLKDPKVSLRYEELLDKVRDEAERRGVAQAVDVLEELSDIALGRKAFPGYDMFGNELERKPSMSARLKALELLGKHHKLFADKVEQTGETTLRLELGAGLEEMAK